MLDTAERHCLQQDILCPRQETHQCPLEGPSALAVRKVSANGFSRDSAPLPQAQDGGLGRTSWPWHRMVAPCAFTGSAHRGAALPNTERTRTRAALRNSR